MLDTTITASPTTMVMVPTTTPDTTSLASVRLRLLLRPMLMLDTTITASPTTMVMVPTTTPDTTSSASVRLRLLPRLMLTLICITALFTTPTLVATPATSSASKETAKTDIIRIHRLPDLEIKLL